MEQISIIQYSSKAIVITGDTKPIKEMLKLAGGKFNARLTHPKTLRPLVGWIFSKSRQSQVEDLLHGNNVKFSADMPDNINSGNFRDFIPDPAEQEADNFCRTNNI